MYATPDYYYWAWCYALVTGACVFFFISKDGLDRKNIVTSSSSGFMISAWFLASFGYLTGTDCVMAGSVGFSIASLILLVVDVLSIYFGLLYKKFCVWKEEKI